ncbi:hypothetical protein D3C87_1606650 [compost metagenome]
MAGLRELRGDGGGACVSLDDAAKVHLVGAVVHDCVLDGAGHDAARHHAADGPTIGIAAQAPAAFQDLATFTRAPHQVLRRHGSPAVAAIAHRHSGNDSRDFALSLAALP